MVAVSLERTDSARADGSSTDVALSPQELAHQVTTRCNTRLTHIEISAMCRSDLINAAHKHYPRAEFSASMFMPQLHGIEQTVRFRRLSLTVAPGTAHGLDLLLQQKPALFSNIQHLAITYSLPDETLPLSDLLNAMPQLQGLSYKSRVSRPPQLDAFTPPNLTSLTLQDYSLTWKDLERFAACAPSSLYLATRDTFPTQHSQPLATLFSNCQDLTLDCPAPPHSQALFTVLGQSRPLRHLYLGPALSATLISGLGQLTTKSHPVRQLQTLSLVLSDNADARIQQLSLLTNLDELHLLNAAHLPRTMPLSQLNLSSLTSFHSAFSLDYAQLNQFVARHPRLTKLRLAQQRWDTSDTLPPQQYHLSHLVFVDSRLAQDCLESLIGAKLISLALDKTDVVATNKSIATALNLKKLRCHNCNLSMKFIESLLDRSAASAALVDVDLSECQLDTYEPRSVELSYPIKRLILRNSQLSKTQLLYLLKSCPALIELDLSGCSAVKALTATDVQDLKLPQLQSLKLTPGTAAEPIKQVLLQARDAHFRYNGQPIPPGGEAEHKQAQALVWGAVNTDAQQAVIYSTEQRTILKM